MSQPDRDEPRREWPVDLAEVVEAVSALPLEVRAELALGSLPDDQGCRACKALHATAPVHDTPANRLQHWHEALVRHHAGHGREQDATRAGMIYGVALAQVVESREPFPSDEDVEAGAKALMEKWPETRMVLGEINAPLVARAVLDAVSSHPTEEALKELLRHSPVEGGLVEKVRWLIEDHALLYRVCATRWRALRAIEGPASDGDPYIEVYRAAGGGYEGLQAIARAALQREAVSSHRDDEAREDGITLETHAGAVTWRQQPTEAEVRARAVSDVVDRVRGFGQTKMNAEWLARAIEKWAADRKAGT